MTHALAVAKVGVTRDSDLIGGNVANGQSGGDQIVELAIDRQLFVPGSQDDACLKNSCCGDRGLVVLEHAAEQHLPIGFAIKDGDDCRRVNDDHLGRPCSS